MTGSHTDAIGWSADGGVRLLDQTRLPGELWYLELHTIDEMVEAIRTLRVRGAPLIGIAAAMGLAVAAKQETARDGRGRSGTVEDGAGLTREWVDEAIRKLGASRPTAVNLCWALECMRGAAQAAFRSNQHEAAVAEALRAEAQRIWDEDATMCEAIGAAGAELVPEGATILTHCNTGSLATGGIGTAFGVILTAHHQGKGIDVVATETRPLGQGARLTSWELQRHGIPGRVIVDSAAGALMARGEVDLVITGADRISANGDAANKIGTYALAVLAQAHGIPFYLAAPRSTFDLALESGDAIPIEERPASEVVTAPGIQAHNPAFDVTPADLITAMVTDRGVMRAPYTHGIAALLASAAVLR